MGILGRFKNIMSCNIKSILNKSKDPKADIQKYLAQLELDLGTVKSESEAILVHENRIRRELGEYEETIDKYDRYAQKASENGKSRDAKIYLSKKEGLLPRYNSLKEAYEKASDATNKFTQLQSKLTEDIAELKSKLGQLEGMGNSSKATEMKDKVEDIIYTAEALEELNNLGSSKDDDLDAEFEKLLSDDN